MEHKPTDELNDMLENMKPDQLDDYIKKNRKYLADEKKAFYYYMKDHHLKSILAANQDKLYLESKKMDGPDDDSMGYLRGSDYYAGGDS